MSPSAGSGPLTRRSTRIIAAAKLRRRRDRDRAGRFLAEGPQAVREALATGALDRQPGSIGGHGSIGGSGATSVVEVFATEAAGQRYPELLAAAASNGVVVWTITEDAAAALTETVSPQGLVAVCEAPDRQLATALGAGPQLVAVLVEIRDPGNAGTVLRTADAAGAGVVVFAGDAVDPYNGKCVRASAGSLFHVDLVRHRQPTEVITAARAAGLRVLAAAGSGETDLDDLADAGALAGPTAWVFGSEAHGLSDAVLAAADHRVRVPIHGRAESLNLGAAAAVCLYASARVLRVSARSKDSAA